MGNEIDNTSAEQIQQNNADDYAEGLRWGTAVKCMTAEEWAAEEAQWEAYHDNEADEFYRWQRLKALEREQEELRDRIQIELEIKMQSTKAFIETGFYDPEGTCLHCHEEAEDIDPDKGFCSYCMKQWHSD